MNKSDNKVAKKVKKVIKKKKIVKKKVKIEVNEDKNDETDEEIVWIPISEEKKSKLDIKFEFNKMHKLNENGSADSMEERKVVLNNVFKKCVNCFSLKDYDLMEDKDIFVRLYENTLASDFCQHIIDIFEKKVDLHSEMPVTSHELNLMKKDPKLLDGHISSKITKELHITRNKDELELEDNYVSKILGKYLTQYVSDISEETPWTAQQMFQFIGGKDTGYQIQKYNKNEGRYFWHSDSNNTFMDDKRTMLGERTLTFLFYLNDVEDGGETLFHNFKVRPKKGRLLFFPSTWSYYHSGNIPISDDKYIITGWIHNVRSINDYFHI